MKKRNQNIDYHTPVLRFFWHFELPLLQLVHYSPYPMAAYDETVRFRAIPENRWPSKDTRCISSVTGSCCGAETPPQRPYPSHQHCGCYVESIPIEFPTLYRYVSIMMAQNRGPFNWMGRLVPRLGSHKVFYCSSTYVQLVDSNVFFSRVVFGWWFQLCCTFQP